MFSQTNVRKIIDRLILSIEEFGVENPDVFKNEMFSTLLINALVQMSITTYNCSELNKEYVSENKENFLRDICAIYDAYINSFKEEEIN